LQWFPQDQWEEEFNLAAESSSHYIELITERDHNEKNPIWSDSGLEKIKSLCKKHGLNLQVLCNDYIIDHSLMRDPSCIEQTLKLMERMHLLGIRKLVLPMFEASEMDASNWQGFC
jgi:L-ribulose-5-phosphate 3-epimerase UlaE